MFCVRLYLQHIKLSSIKVDTRYTTTQQVVKLIGSHTISKVTVKIGDLKRTKRVRTVNLYYNNRTVQAIVELKNKYGLVSLGEVRACGARRLVSALTAGARPSGTLLAAQYVSSCNSGRGWGIKMQCRLLRVRTEAVRSCLWGPRSPGSAAA